MREPFGCARGQSQSDQTTAYFPRQSAKVGSKLAAPGDLVRFAPVRRRTSMEGKMHRTACALDERVKILYGFALGKTRNGLYMGAANLRRRPGLPHEQV